MSEANEPSRAKRVSWFLLALLYALAGLNHFLDPGFYLRMMPPYLPWHEGLVALSGVAEIALGLAVLLPRLRPWAGLGLVALLLAVFPANLHMALHPEDFASFPSWGLYLRLPVQLLLIAWAWWATRPEPERAP